MNFVEVHPRHVTLPAPAAISGARAIVCGGGEFRLLGKQALELGVAERFIEDIHAALGFARAVRQ